MERLSLGVSKKTQALTTCKRKDSWRFKQCAKGDIPIMVCKKCWPTKKSFDKTPVPRRMCLCKLFKIVDAIIIKHMTKACWRKK